jgi:hypothetical protein
MEMSSTRPPGRSPFSYRPGPGDSGDQSASQSKKGDRIIPVTFGGGIERGVAPNMIPEGAARLLQNCYYPREVSTPTTRPGLTPLLASALPGAVTGVYAYQSPTKSYTVVSCLNGNAQELYYLDDENVPQLISASLGGVTPPTFRTFNGRLVVAVAGVYLQTWNGVELAWDNNVPVVGARAAGSVEFTGVPAVGETLQIGDRLFTFWDERYTSGEVAIGNDAEACAANLLAAIVTDSADVRASIDQGDLSTVVLEARLTGAGGNSYPLAGTASNVTLTPASGHLEGGGLEGGGDGLGWDVIDSYGAPMGGIITSDRNGRLVSGGDTRAGMQDLLRFSAPGNDYAWASDDLGYGQYWNLGQLEGNVITAIVAYFDELWVHKYGENREIHRVRVADPNPETWDLQVRPYSDTQAAAAARACLAAGDKLLVLDRDFLGVYEPSDGYDEIRAGLDGNKVHDLINGTVRASAFMALNPAEGYALVFPNAGRACLVYHYSSRRWTYWTFPRIAPTCACYSEAKGTMLFGSNDGMVFVLDPTSATDWELPFQTVIMTPTYGMETLEELLIKQVIIDYTQQHAGWGSIYIINNRNEAAPQLLCTFKIDGSGLMLAGAMTLPLEPPTEGAPSGMTTYFTSSPFGRIVNHSHAVGESLALKIVLERGAFAVNSAALRCSTTGRAFE